MKTIGDIQRSAQDNEKDLAKRLAAAESQAVELREKVILLEFEKKAMEDALDAAKVACSAHESTIARLRQGISESKIGSAHHESQIQHERDLRSKAEEKAGEERAERIALAAQLNAQLREHVQSEKQLRESMEGMQRRLTEQIRLQDQESSNMDDEIKAYKEVITRLEAQQLSLKQTLTEQKSMLDASKEEEIDRLKDEIANLESKLTSEVKNLQSASVASEARVQELEAIIQQGMLERKRWVTKFERVLISKHHCQSRKKLTSSCCFSSSACTISFKSYGVTYESSLALDPSYQMREGKAMMAVHL
jgi:chromosome segregation ATPase